MQLNFLDNLRAEVAATVGGIIPRDYQAAAVDASFKLWAGGSLGCIVRQPTGTGKTIVSILAAERWNAQGDEYRTMVFCHEKQLLDQFAEEIEDITGVAPGVEQGADNQVKVNRLPKIIVASRDSMRVRTIKDAEGNEAQVSRLWKFDNTRYKWLLIFDEVHRYQVSMKSAREIFTWFRANPACKTLGVTATPYRGDKKTLAKVTPDVAADYRLFDIDGGKCAVLDGWVVPYDQRFIIVESVDFTKIKETAKDFDEGELETQLTETKALASCVDPMIDLVAGRQTLVFCVTIAHAKAVASYINALAEKRRADGWPDEQIHGEAVELDGTVPHRFRNDVYDRHQRKEFQFLVVCSLCREGYNDPGLEAIAIFRPTKSRTFAEQMKGRGCRTLRGCVKSTMTKAERLDAIAASEKRNCMIIDLVGVSGMADCASTAQILAEGLPDEVIDLANRNATNKAKKDPTVPIDMAEEVRKAKRDIDEEREAARLAREAEVAERRREAERRASLGARVSYTAQQVEQGHGARTHRPKGQRKGPVMIFGKHKGKPLAEIPAGYLQSMVEGEWCKTEWLKKAAASELGRRRNPQQQQYQQQPETPRGGNGHIPGGLSLDEVNALLMSR